MKNNKDVPEKISSTAYNKLLGEHAEMAAKWRMYGDAAASSYPDRMTNEHAEWYKMAVRLSSECKAFWDKIVAYGKTPQPSHWAMPVPEFAAKVKLSPLR